MKTCINSNYKVSHCQKAKGLEKLKLQQEKGSNEQKVEHIITNCTRLSKKLTFGFCSLI